VEPFWEIRMALTRPLPTGLLQMTGSLDYGQWRLQGSLLIWDCIGTCPAPREHGTTYRQTLATAHQQKVMHRVAKYVVHPALMLRNFLFLTRVLDFSCVATYVLGNSSSDKFSATGKNAYAS